MSEAEEKSVSFGSLTPAEAGRLGGKKSGEARAARKDLSWLRDRARELLPELVAAARREGKWEELPPDKSFQALKLVLEYGFGKPTTTKGDEEATDSAPEGLTIAMFGANDAEE